MLIDFAYANLVVSMAQVDGAKDSSLSQVVKQVCNVGNRKYIKLHLTIQAMVVDAHSKLASFLLNEENWSAIGHYAGTYAPPLKQLLHLLLYFSTFSQTESILLVFRRR